MTEIAEAVEAEAITRTIDARGSFCPGPLMELIRGIREAAVGDVLAVWRGHCQRTHRRRRTTARTALAL